MLASIVDLILRRAEASPNETAYTFLSDRDDPATLTYAELQERSAALALALGETGQVGDRVLLLLRPGIKYIVAVFACLYAGRIAVPAFPPNPARLARNLSRLEAICADADASAAVTDVEILPLIDVFRDQAPRLGRLRWLAADVDAGGLRRAPTPFDLAVLQYTSGSTSEPKGVVLGHDNLLYNLELIRREFGQSAETRGVFWLPPYHDMGLVGGILEPLYAGYPSVLLSPASFFTRPLRWLEAIERYGGTTSGAPNFAYDLCIEKTLPEERARLDLKSWTVAFNGAEPIRADTLNRFAAAFAQSGFRKSSFLSCYGLAEATLLVCCGTLGSQPAIRSVDRGALSAGRVEPGDGSLVSCGHSADGLLVEVVDPTTGASVSDGTVGEVWISGASVARGYWRRPEHPSFGATLVDAPGRTFLRTGDLGAWVDGELVIAGREKDLILVRGRNIYPQDLEFAVERAHPAVQGGRAAAFAEDETDGGDAAIVMVCELKRGYSAADVEAIARTVRRAVAERCEVAVTLVVLVKPGAIPMTTSGKIRRRACRADLLAGTLKVLAQSRALVRTIEGPDREQILAARGEARTALVGELIVATAARLGGANMEDGASLLDLVTNSFDAAEIAAELNSVLGVEVELADVLGDVQVADLAARLAERMDVPPASRPASDPGELSPGQAALWLVQRLSPSSAANNVTAALRIHGRIDPDVVAQAIAAVGCRHGQLRIAILVRGGQPYAVESPLPELVRITLSNESDVASTVAGIAAEPFDLERGPLWRVAWLDRPSPILLLCAHHSIADYASLQIILSDLEKVLLGRLLPTLSYGYADLIAHEAARYGPAKRSANSAFWAAELAHVPVLDLPSPKPRPTRPTHLGTQHEIVFPNSTLEALRAFARAERATLHTVLLAGLHALLHRWTGQEDVVIGTPVTSRHLPWTRTLVGYCVNPIPVRAHPRTDRPFIELVREVRDRVIAGLAHELPFPSIVEAAGQRDPGRTPVFQALFALEKAVDGACGVLIPRASRRFRFADLEAEPLLVRPSHVAFDLTVLVEKSQVGLAAAFQVGEDALDGTCAARLADQWIRLLDAGCRTPGEAIGRLALLSSAERAFVVEEVNCTASPMPQRCLHALVAAQAERTPDAVALISGTRMLTYRELVCRAAALAHDLCARGVGPETRVGLYMDRVEELVVSVLGILGSGCAYVYLDPRYPRDRLAFMLEDAGVAVVVTREMLVPTMPTSSARVLTLETITSSIDAMAFPESGVCPEHLAYVIYTSGSTGRPKGVAIEHRNAAALIGWAHDEYDRSMFQGTLAATSLAFDLSVFELFAPLTCGGSVILADTVLELSRLPARDRVTLVNTVPSAMTELLAAKAVPPRVRVVNLAGEPLTAALAAAVHGLAHVERLYNLYGPTEDTTYSTFERVERGSTPTLGRPLSNRTAYVLDGMGQPVPLGVVGEICLGGAGVTRGYLNRPELTAERFVESAMIDAPGRLYRTGDLGRRLADGRIEYLGRRDRQVKVRGFRIELGEIVSSLVEHPSVADAAIIADPEHRLLAYVSAPDGADPGALRAHLEARLPPFMIPSQITVLASLPMTSKRQGGPQRARCDGADATGPCARGSGESYRGRARGNLARGSRRGGERERRLFRARGAFAARCSRASPDSRSVRCRSTSLYTLRAAHHRAAIPSDRIGNDVNAGTADPSGPARAPPLRRSQPQRGQEMTALSYEEVLSGNGGEYNTFPLSSSQERLWFLHQLAPTDPAYHMCGAFRFLGPLDLDRLADVVCTVCRRHEALRTVFRELDERPVQVVLPDPVTRLVVRSIADDDLSAGVRAEGRRPFDLKVAPARFTCLRIGAEDHALVVAIHHLVCDGLSVAILIREFSALYGGTTLDPLPIQFADFALWERAQIAEGAFQADLAWWRELLAGMPMSLGLQPPVQGAHTFAIPSSIVGSIQNLAASLETTPFVVVLAAFAGALGEHLGRTELIVGTPVAGRPSIETEGVVGLFVNTIPIPIRLSPRSSLRDAARALRGTVTHALTHAGVPFDRIVDAVAAPRSSAEAPLVQALIAWRPGAELTEFVIPGAVTVELAVDLEAPKFDVSLEVAPARDAWAARLEFAKLQPNTAANLARRLVDILASDPDRLFAIESVAGVDLGVAPEPVLAEPDVVDATERIVAHVWREILGTAPGRNDNFFASGGHSLLGARILTRIRARTGVDLPLRTLFEAPTIAALADRVRSSGRTTVELIPKAPPGPIVPSSGQQALWLLHRFDPTSVAYNISGILRIEGSIDAKALSAALRTVVARQPGLRTTIHLIDGAPVQVVSEEAKLDLEVCALGDCSSEALDAALRSAADRLAAFPFDFAHDLLLRATWIDGGRAGSGLVLGTTHAAFDGSHAVFFSELERAYAAEQGLTLNRPAPSISYSDYAAWQRARLPEVIRAHLPYWTRQLSSDPGPLELPTDRPRPPVRSGRGAVRTFAIDVTLANRVRTFARTNSASVHMVLFAAWTVLLHRFSGQERFMVGSPVEVRPADAEDVVGCFVNPVVLAVDLSGRPAFGEIVAKMRTLVLDAHAHAECPFHVLVETLGRPRDLSRNPLFDGMFVFADLPIPPRLGTTTTRFLEWNPSVARFDILWALHDVANGGFGGSVEYATDLFDSSTVDRMIELFTVLLSAALDAPATGVDALSLLRRPERHKILVEWNRTRRDIPGELTLHRRFERAADRSPAAPAVLAQQTVLTYAELDARANRWAHLLIGCGIGVGDRVRVLGRPVRRIDRGPARNSQSRRRLCPDGRELACGASGVGRAGARLASNRHAGALCLHAGRHRSANTSAPGRDR